MRMVFFFICVYVCVRMFIFILFVFLDVRSLFASLRAKVDLLNYASKAIMLSSMLGVCCTPHKRVNIFCPFSSIIQYLKQFSTVNIGGTITPSSIHFMHFKTYLKHFVCVCVFFPRDSLSVGKNGKLNGKKVCFFITISCSNAVELLIVGILLY